MTCKEHWRAFGPEWFENHQGTLLRLFACPLIGRWLRWVLRIRKFDVGYQREILDIRPHCYTVAGEQEGTLTTDFRTHWKFSKRLYFAFRPLWWVLHGWDWLIADRLVPSFSFGFQSLTVYPDADPETETVDGYARCAGKNETWTALLDDTAISTDSSSVNIVVEIKASATTNQWDTCNRAILLFNTSGLQGSVVSATLSLNGNSYGSVDGLGVNPDLNIYSSNPVSNTSLAVADYNTLGTTPFSTAIPFSSWSDPSYNDFAFNSSGKAAIVQGITKLGVRNANYDVARVAPTWSSLGDTYFQFAGADAAGSAADPKLVVTYELVSPIQRKRSLRPRVTAPGIAR